MNKIIFILILLLIPCVSSENYQVKIFSEIPIQDYNSESTFIGEIGIDSNDWFDIQDGLLIEMPQYAASFYTIIDDNFLMLDSRKLIEEKYIVWEINQKASRDFRRSGMLNEKITWDTSRLPENAIVGLIDYGNDLKRISIVRKVDLMKEKDYSFSIESPYEDYRYFELIVFIPKKLEKSASTTLNGAESSGGGGGGSSTGSGSQNKVGKTILSSGETIIMPSDNKNSPDAKYNFEEIMGNYTLEKSKEKLVEGKNWIIWIMIGIFVLLILIALSLIIRKR